MTSPQLARLDEHPQRLRLNTVRERLEALLQEASAQELSYADFPRPAAERGSDGEDCPARPDADEPGPVPVPQGARQLRFPLPALGRPEAGPEAEPVPLRRARGEPRPARAAESGFMMHTSLCHWKSSTS